MNLRRFDYAWDSMAYHLPFAALRVGLVSHQEFSMRPDLLERYNGFPPLADFLQGLLWRVTGAPEAATLLAPISLALMSIYARWTAKIAIFWSAAVVLAIPTAHLALASANVDLWTNLFFCTFLLASWKILLRPDRHWPVHTAIAAMSLAVTSLSKPQFVVLGPIALSLVFITGLLLLDRDPGHTRSVRIRSLCLLLCLSPGVLFWPLRNYFVFGNPVYPISVSFASLGLPGPEPAIYVGPRTLRHIPQMVRYLLSQLDFNAIDLRPHGYTVDQGYVPNGADGDRMGGSFAAFLLGTAASLILAWQRSPPGRQGTIIAVSAMALFLIVANFPQSHELRYFLFVNVMLGVAALAWLECNARHDAGYSAGLLVGFRLLILASAVFVTSATGFHTLSLLGSETRQEYVVQEGFDTTAITAAEASPVICYLRPDPNAFFFTPLLNPHAHAGKVFVPILPADCPPGSYLLK